MGRGGTASPVASRAKRAMDVLGAAMGLVVFALPMAVIGLLVRTCIGSPVLFTQIRPGLHGEPFKLFKFRTMQDAVDIHGQPLPDDERLTALGRKLRSSSLDELPELWNVLRGDMSLVGPRPLLVHYLNLYTAEQRRRHEVRPGLTGLAQVRGRNAQTWARKLALDIEYVDRWSLWLDLSILARTIVVVVRRQGITQSGTATAEEFRGQPG